MVALPMFPLESVVLPGERLPLRIFEPRYRRLLADCLAGDRRFATVLIEAGREVGGGERRCDVGVVVTIAEHRTLGSGQQAVVGVAGERIRVTRWLPDDPYPRAAAQVWPDEPGAPVSADAVGELEERLLALYRRLSQRPPVPVPPREVLFGPAQTAVPQRLYNLAARIPIGPADRYAVLAAPSAAARLAALADAVDTLTARVQFQSR